MLQAYQGYFEKGLFHTAGRTIPIPERKQIILTILEEIPAQESLDEEMEQRKAWINRLETAINLSLDEELPDLPHSTLMREPVNLAD